MNGNITNEEEWKFYTCVTGFCSKVGVGLAAGIIGIVTSLSGYVGGAEVQSASAQTAIVSLYTILPALLMALSIVAMYFYNLDKELPTVRGLASAAAVDKRASDFVGTA